jgi:hypothetical protein
MSNVVALIALSLKQSLIQIAFVENKIVPRMAITKPWLYNLFCFILLR